MVDRFLLFCAPFQLLMSKKSPLVALTVLKKICDHPRLLSLRACHQLGMHGQGLVTVHILCACMRARMMDGTFQATARFQESDIFQKVKLTLRHIFESEIPPVFRIQIQTWSHPWCVCMCGGVRVFMHMCVCMKEHSCCLRLVC